MPGPAEIAIGMQLDPNRGNHLKKQISLNGKHVRAGTAVGVLRSVLFEPGDIELVSGAPSVRRRYLDIMLSQLDPVYLRSLSRYIRVVEQRNRLIKNLVQSGANWNNAVTRQQLDYWDGELIASRRGDSCSACFSPCRELDQFGGGALHILHRGFQSRGCL